jgi:multimeric flavodoxin WrbA
MRKVLGVVGSPRKGGNTHILVSRILDGAKEAGAATQELLLGELEIKECDGCHLCWEGKECSKGDDMNEIYDKIIDSDVIVFGTPVYWYGPTALMKAFIDRFVYFNCPENREKIRGKEAVIAVVFEEERVETASLVEEFFRRSLDYLEMNLRGRIVVPGVSDKGDILKKKASLAAGCETGRKIGAKKDAG